jgi:hypothetical protein
MYVEYQKNKPIIKIIKLLLEYLFYLLNHVLFILFNSKKIFEFGSKGK